MRRDLPIRLFVLDRLIQLRNSGHVIPNPTSTIHKIMTMKKKTTAAFTLIELLVVIAIIAVLASIALPVFSSVQIKGAQTKALSNGKQIALALRLYASDNNGTYPSYLVDADGTPTTNPPTAVSSSNDAFCQLFPNYIKSEAIFWLSKSKWCSTGSPDEAQDSTLTVPSSETLKSGENEWAYVVGLNETSNPAVPLLADGFITGGETSHRYSKDQTVQGGVWKGVNAIVIRADSSGTVEKVNADLTIHGPNGSSGGTQGDIFTTANSSNGWLGTANTVVNPK
jgi:prepilin-type N-terminal cleavage/methylation domain-containing protein